MTFLSALFSCNLQRNMLYYPSNNVPPQSALAVHNLQFWPSEVNYRGFITAQQIKKAKGTIVVFHGNAGTAADRQYYGKVLSQLGYRVLLAEYPGYGNRKGELSEESFVQDGQETLKLIFEQFGSPIFLLGESLGSGVAAAVAKNAAIKIDGIILITPWDTLLSVAKEKFPWFFPVRLFMKDKYDTVKNLKEYHGRIAIVGAEQDEIIPIHHAEALSASLSTTHKMDVVKNSYHNDWPERVDLEWWKMVMGFVQGNEKE